MITELVNHYYYFLLQSSEIISFNNNSRVPSLTLNENIKLVL